MHMHNSWFSNLSCSSFTSEECSLILTIIFYLVFNVILLCIFFNCILYLKQSWKSHNLLKLILPKLLQLFCFWPFASVHNQRQHRHAAPSCASAVSRLTSSAGQEEGGSRWPPGGAGSRAEREGYGLVASAVPLFSPHLEVLDRTPPTVECCKVNHVDISLYVPNISIVWNRSCGALIYVQW